jgi:flagellar basal-body rod modification protein FlgD
MAVSGIGGTVSDTAAGAAPQNLGVSQQDFLKILATQLSFQDPLKPIDNEQFIAQLAQFTTLEQTRQLTDSVQALLGVQASTQSVGLLGKTVDVTATDGSTVTGTVTTVKFNAGQPLLSLQLADGSFLTDVNPASVTLVR